MRWRARFLLVLTALILMTGACSPSGNGDSVQSGDGDTAGVPSAPPPPPPPPELVDLMDRTSMTGEARTLFLDAKPRIEGMAELVNNCKNKSGSHTLGCFLVIKECQTGGASSGCSRKTQIHLLRIDRPDAHDLIYVSAAHEMLHAAYEQLTPQDRTQIDRQLEAALPQLDKCRVDNNLGAYANQVGADRMSELHSILATEFSVLPPGLQSHFNRYFSYRQLVVSAHDRTLGNREKEICSLQARLEQLEGQIGSMRRQLQQLRSADNVQAYNALVPRFNALAREQNRAADAHNRTVREYNRLLESVGGNPGALAPREAPATPAQ